LHPPMLDHLGLAATLQHFCQQFGGQTGIEVTVDEQGQKLPLGRLAADSLFRSVKELVNNAAKHGPAKEVVTSLHWTPGRLRIIVDDDGPGFDPAVALAPGSKCLGLAGIRERMLPLGGTMRVESSAGNGTRVVLEIPLTPKETS
jgi:signal transduction histidine kinase